MLEVIRDLGSWVSYPPRLAQCLGGVKETIFLVYILQCSRISEDEYVYKTREQIEEETGLSRYEQETARKKLKEIGVLEETYKGIPRTLHYKVKLDTLNMLWNEWLNQQDGGDSTSKSVEKPPASRWKNHHQVGGNPTNKSVEKPPTGEAEFSSSDEEIRDSNTEDNVEDEKEKKKEKKKVDKKEKKKEKKIEEIEKDIGKEEEIYINRIFEGEPTEKIHQRFANEKPKDAFTNSTGLGLGEFAEPVVMLLQTIGFPRKSLRSKDDQEQIGEILNKCDNDISLFLRKLQTLSTQKEIRLLEYGGKIDLKRLRERWDDLTVEVEIPDMKGWTLTKVALHCLKNNYVNGQIVMISKAYIYQNNLSRSKIYELVKVIKRKMDELYYNAKREKPNEINGIDLSNLLNRMD